MSADDSLHHIVFKLTPPVTIKGHRLPLKTESESPGKRSEEAPQWKYAPTHKRKAMCQISEQPMMPSGSHLFVKLSILDSQNLASI
jgi:hypothetical protein